MEDLFVFSFYDKLSVEQRKRYDLMIKTNYVLLRCDELQFIEVDEYGDESRSISWIHSIQSTLELFGFDSDLYPQGSLSANRHYYEAMRNYLFREYPNKPEYNERNKSLLNFIRLRQNDSSPNGNNLFGSYYEIGKLKGSRNSRNIRIVHTSLRHSATSLWVLCEESKPVLNKKLEISIVSFMEDTRKYLSMNKDWNNDSYKHLTISSVINTCSSIMINFPYYNISKDAKEIKKICEEVIFSDECMNEKIDGFYEWRLPNRRDSNLAKYKYYLNAFALTQVPELLKNNKAQSVVCEMISNRVNSEYGEGIPIHNIVDFSNEDKIMPDFGSTASVLYLVWYCLENKVGDHSWLKYCKENFDWLLHSCLNIYEKPECYVLPHSENNTKVMLMPRYDSTSDNDMLLKQYIKEIRDSIGIEMRYHEGKLSKKINKINCPEGLQHVVKIIDSWDIPKYWKKQKKWTFDDSVNRLGEFAGAYTWGLLRAIARSV